MILIDKALAAITDDALKLTTTNNASSLSAIATKVFNWVAIVAGVIAFFYLLYSGILYLTAGGNADQAKKAQQGILNAVIGLVIIILAYAITTAIITTLGQ